MSSVVPALPPGQVWVASSVFGNRIHVANLHGQRAHCGRQLMLPGEAGNQMIDAPEVLEDVCRRCAERVLPLAQALDIV